MNKTTFFLSTSLLSLAAATSFAAILPGDIVGVDFGPTAPDNNYNGVIGNTTVSNLIRLSDGTSTGTSFTLSGLGTGPNGGVNYQSFSNNEPISQTGYPASLGINDSNTTDFVGEFTNGVPTDTSFTLSFSGLDNSLTYNFYGISSFTGGTYNIIYTSGVSTFTVVSNDSSSNGLGMFTGLNTDGAGTISIEVTNTSPSNQNGGVAFTNAVALQAVPEPSTWLAMLSGGVLLVSLQGLRRRSRE